VSPSRAPVLSFAYYLYFQATNFAHLLFFISPGHFTAVPRKIENNAYSATVLFPPQERTSRAGLIVYAFDCTSAFKVSNIVRLVGVSLFALLPKGDIKENCSSFSICKRIDFLITL